jgi:hypothetical protein
MIEIYKFCEFVASIDKHISSDIDVKKIDDEDNYNNLRLVSNHMMIKLSL